MRIDNNASRATVDKHNLSNESSFLQATILQLCVWEEFIGIFLDLFARGENLCLLFTTVARNQFFKSIHPFSSPEIEMLKKTLNKSAIGKTIGIMKTDHYHNPLVVRIIEDENSEGWH